MANIRVRSICLICVWSCLNFPLLVGVSFLISCERGLDFSSIELPGAHSSVITGPFQVNCNSIKRNDVCLLDVPHTVFMPPGKRRTTKRGRLRLKAYKRPSCKHEGGCQIEARDGTVFAGFCINHNKAFQAAGGLIALTQVRQHTYNTYSNCLYGVQCEVICGHFSRCSKLAM